MELQHNYNLKQHNTFGVDCVASQFIEFTSESEIQSTLQSKQFSDLYHAGPHFVLGGGSNVLFTSDFSGLVLRANIKHIDVVKTTEENVYVEVGAGVIWDDFVAFAVENNWYGAENLSQIPGTVGSIPVQNIGAYGTEVSEIIDTVHFYYLNTGLKAELKGRDCKFGYRTSIFKHELANEVLVSSVIFKLNKQGELRTEYGSIKEALQASNDYSLKGLRRAIIAIRESKLPNPEVIGNAGSFFKNPEVRMEEATRLSELYPGMPMYTIPNTANMRKLSAAWLIETCGLKGYTKDQAGVYEKHSLILVNKGNAAGKAIAEVAKVVTEAVLAKFGIELEPEVIILGDR